MVGQVDEAYEEISIEQHQTDQIYKAYWKTWYLWKIQESMRATMIATYMRSF